MVDRRAASVAGGCVFDQLSALRPGGTKSKGFAIQPPAFSPLPSLAYRVFDHPSSSGERLVALVHLRGERPVAQYKLVPGEYSIGTDFGCLIVLDELGIDARHLRVVVDDTVRVEDLSSPNGTSINARKLIGQATVAFGSEILLGKSCRLRLERATSRVLWPEPVIDDNGLDGEGSIKECHRIGQPPKLSKVEEREMEILRLREMLVDEIDRRRHAEANWCALREQLATTNIENPEPPVSNHPTLKRIWSIVAATSAVGLAVIGTLASVNWRLKEDARYNEHSLAKLRTSADEFVHKAETHIEAGDMLEAQRELEYALLLTPENAVWRSRLGDVLESRFNFSGALSSYQTALGADSSLKNAADGVVLCERMVRGGELPGRPSRSALYAVHRTMMKHGRIAEAVRVAALLSDDAKLQVETWQERLRLGGLDATLKGDENGRLIVVLRGKVQEHLNLLSGIPAVSLSLVQTDITDIQPISGLLLQHLDLSGTFVAKIEGLKGMPLRTLNLSHTQVEDIFQLRESPLEELDASHTPIRSISGLHSLPLKTLNLSNTKITDLRPLSTSPLSNLDLSKTPVQDIAALAHLPLRSLWLDETQVSDLTPLENSQIEELSLVRAPITSLTPLANSRISALHLSGCAQLEDLSPLKKLRSLQKVTVPAGKDLEATRKMLPGVLVVE